MSPLTSQKLTSEFGKAGGFTLLELLVVVVIVGILASLLTLSVGLVSEDTEIRREAERLQALLELASEESLLNGYEMGVRFYRRGYEFSVYREDTDEWLPITEDRLFRRRNVPDDYELDLEIEGREVILTFESSEKEVYQPQVFILSSGDMTPFMLRVREVFASDGFQVIVEANGSAEVKQDEI